MNLLSGLCLAVAAGVTVDLVRMLTGRLVLGIAAGVAMALTPIAWTIATHAEAHTLHVALVAILLWLLVAWDARVRPNQRDRGDQRDQRDRGDGAHRGDRFLIAATFVFGLAVGNHSLTLLLAIPVALYVLAVDPRIWRRGRLVLSCIAVLVATVVLVYLELPLRAGPFRAPLVYGTPDTWDGFRYIVLAEQFQGSLSDPFGELPRKFGELVSRTVAQFGIIAPLIPVAFVVTVLRRPRYALLTGSAAAITCFFAASYVNADISRYYVGPAMIAWTWLAVLGGAIVDVLAAVGAADVSTFEGAPAAADRAAPNRSARMRADLIALLVAIALVVPTVVEAPQRLDAVDVSGDRQAPSGRTTSRGDGARCGHRQLVELLDPAVVRASGRWSATGHHDRRRPDAARPEPGRPDRRDRQAARQRSPGIRPAP
jgi:4-amino-4-deoxy-L-arabinose transferase-like glycosyltransferase